MSAGSTFSQWAKLDKLSRSFAEALFATHREWLALARVESERDGGKGFLVVEVHGPKGSRLDHPLVITTNNGEVTG